MTKLSKSVLLEQLDEQLYFIEKSIIDYATNEIEAKRVAINIRVLVHDTKNSVSLLNQLHAKGIGFVNTNAHKNSFANWKLNKVTMSGGVFNEKTPYIGIVGKEVTGNSEGIVIKYFPIYQEWKNYHSIIDFNSWWNSEIYDNRNGYTLTRKKLILNVANKDGGAHIDELEPGYNSFKNKNILQFKVNGTLQGFDNIPAYPAVMQIAWELLTSIKNELDNIKK